MARFKRRPLPQRLALGAVAGAAATFVMRGMMTTSGKLMPESRPPINARINARSLDSARKRT